MMFYAQKSCLSIRGIDICFADRNFLVYQLNVK